MATALDVSYPYDGQTALEAQWTDMFRTLPGSGVIAGLDNEMVVAQGTGRQSTVATGRVWAAGQFGKVTGAKAFAHATNGSGQPRIDRVIVRNNFSANQIELDVLTGTPGASPAAPALTSNSSMQEFSLARVGPLASGYTNVLAGDVHDERCLLSPFADGPIFPDAAALALWVPSPTVGMGAFLRVTGQRLSYVGSTDGWTQTWNLPWGFIDSKVVAVDQGSITSIVDVLGASSTFTAVANRIYEYSVRALVSNNTTDGTCQVHITDGGGGDLDYGAIHPHGAGDFHTLAWSTLEVGIGAGTVTRKLRATSAGVGSMGLQNATVPLRFTIKDIGPFGNPV